MEHKKIKKTDHTKHHTKDGLKIPWKWNEKSLNPKTNARNDYTVVLVQVCSLDNRNQTRFRISKRYNVQL